MALRVNEDGGSESRLVMRRIGVEPRGKITPRESGLTSIGCLVTRESAQLTQEAKQMTAVATRTGAASRCKASRQQMRIVKVMYKRYRVLERAF
jgi:hypothetical protein